jgi:hypothetical protein
MTSRVRSILRLTSAVVLLGAARATCPEATPERVPDGNWGGEHVGMVVTDTGATLEYDCAEGRVTGPLRLESDGSFTWVGTHYPGHGGPIRIDEPANAHPARYTGHATSTTVQMTLEVLDMPGTVMTFTMKRGADPHVFKCL